MLHARIYCNDGRSVPLFTHLGRYEVQRVHTDLAELRSKSECLSTPFLLLELSSVQHCQPTRGRVSYVFGRVICTIEGDLPVEVVSG